MSTRRMRSLFKIIAAMGIGALSSILGAASALGNNGPGPWP